MDNYTAIIGKYAGKHSGKALTQYENYAFLRYRKANF